MTVQQSVEGSPAATIFGELRYGGELARLLADAGLRSPRRRRHAPPVVLVPGFMAGDRSLALLRRWLERRGHPVLTSGMRANVDCAERAVVRLVEQVEDFADGAGAPVVLIGQSRGGALARSVAVRSPKIVSALIMLGSPVRGPLAVSAPVLGTVRLLARLGDAGFPGLFSSSCKEGDCCVRFRDDLTAPLAADIEAFAVHSRSDGVVDWRACLDPHARPVEVDSSHCGMSVHPEVYRVIEAVFDGTEGDRWNG
jgi:pimeloyl-ACP methyl ester carboxylesterase